MRFSWKSIIVNDINSVCDCAKYKSFIVFRCDLVRGASSPEIKGEI